MTQTTFTRRLGILAGGCGLAIALVAIGNRAEAGGFPSTPARSTPPSRVSTPPARRAPVVATSAAAENWRTVRARHALDRAVATLRAKSVNGGYPGYIAPGTGSNYGSDLNQRIAADQIVTKYGGTPTFGEMYLEAYRAVNNQQYLNAAIEVARALVWCQNKYGGWPEISSMSGFVRNFSTPPRPDGVISFDDQGATPTCLAFLMDLDREIDEAWLTDAIHFGLQGVLNAQYEVGAWPMMYPAKHESTVSMYFFNDRVTNSAIELLLTAHSLYGNQEYLDAALRGTGFILQMQMDAPAPGWAEQYDFDLLPAEARQWEQPSVSSDATKYNITTLIKVAEYTHDASYLSAAYRAADWLVSAQVGDEKWSRHYELGTGVPVYFDRNGTKYYHWEDMPIELVPPGMEARHDNRGVAYVFDGDRAIPRVLAEVERVRQFGLGGSAPDPNAGYVAPLRQLELRYDGKWKKIEPLVLDVDNDGGWLLRTRRGRFYTLGEFRNGMRRLVDFLDLDRQLQDARNEGR